MATSIRRRAPRRTIVSQAKEFDPEKALERVGRAAEELRAGLTAGLVAGPWVDGLPRYVWHRAGDTGDTGDTIVEFRLSDPARAEYARYELHPSEWPEGVV
jgi:hypothetical protein